MSRPVAIVALIWIVALMVLFTFPTSGNISWPFMAAAVLFLLIYYFAWARKHFHRTAIDGRSRQITEIEREFEWRPGRVNWPDPLPPIEPSRGRPAGSVEGLNHHGKAAP